MKRLLLLAAFVMVGLSAKAFIYCTPTGDTLTFSVISGSNNAVCVEKTPGEQYVGNLIIPSTVEYNGVIYTVTHVNQNGFINCSQITSITLPTTVTHIENNAFKGCTGLTSINLDVPLQVIGGNAFEGCTGLTEVTIPTSVNSLGGFAFMNCSNLATVNLNADSLYLGYWTWGNYPFSGTGLTTLNVGANVKRLPNYIFYNCTQLTSLSLGASLRRIDNGAFYGCSSLTSVNIPDSTTYIGNKAFYQCTNLSQLSLGNSVDTILGYAFYQCDIHSITIPRSVKYIESYAFFGNPYLTTLEFNADSCVFNHFYFTFDTNFTSVTIGDSVRYVPSGFIRRNTHVTEIVLPDAVRIVDDAAFYGCSGLSTLFVGRGLVYVYSSAFSICNITTLYYNADSVSNYSDFFGNEITTLTLGSNVRIIPNSIFNGCNNISGPLVLPSGVERVGRYAFYNCDGVTSITIPYSVQFIGEDAFRGCDSLTAIYFDASNCSIQNNNSPFGSAYGDHPKPFIVNFGGAVVKIPDNIFRGCNYLSSFTIGGGTTAIGDYAFASCRRLQSIVIPYPISVIGSHAFSYCDSVTTLTLPNSLDSIANDAFSQMSSLQRVDFMGTAEQWCGIVFKSNPVSTSRCLYINNQPVEYLILAAGATKVNANAFKRCNSLRRINTGHACSVIEESAFNDCDSLHTVIFGSGLDSIGYQAFYYCNNIDSVVCLSTVPPAIVNGSFHYYGNTVTLHVPCGSGQAYLASSWHNYFNNITEMFLNNIVALSDNDLQGSAEVTQLPSCSNQTAVIAATANSGYHFAHWQDGNTANPRTVTVTSDVTYTAYFEIDEIPIPDTVYYSVTVSVNNAAMGSATVNGVSYAVVAEGETVTLVATANEGHHFVKWSDNNAANPRSLTVTRDTALYAVFAKNQYTVTVTADGNGTVTGGGEYEYLEIATLIAIANSGYHFAHWQDGNTENHRTVTVTSDTTYTAYFEKTCDAISSFPWNNHFDRELSCWSTVDADGDGFNWEYYHEGYGMNGVSSETIYYIDGDIQNLNPDNWIVSPMIELPQNGIYSLSWYIPRDVYDDYIGQQHYTVYVSTSGNSIDDFSTQLFAENLLETDVHRNVSLQDYRGQSIHIAFRHHNTYSFIPLILADIKIDVHTQGIEEVSGKDISIYCENGCINVSANNQTVDEFFVYDLMGRMVFHSTHSGKTSPLPGGVYFVKVGNYNVQRVVVIR